MKIKVNVSVGQLDRCYIPGQEYNIDDAEADRLIRAGQATAVNADYKPKPVKMDARASTPIEEIDTVKAKQPGEGKIDPPANSPAAIAGTAPAPHAQGKIDPPARIPTAVELAKKAGK